MRVGSKISGENITDTRELTSAAVGMLRLWHPVSTARGDKIIRALARLRNPEKAPRTV